MKKKKKYTKYEKLHFLHDYKESGLSLNEYCTRNKINYYEMRAWLVNYKNKIKDAGSIIDTRVNNPNLSNYKAKQKINDDSKKLSRTVILNVHPIRVEKNRKTTDLLLRL
ncbi:MAG: transposase [Pleomorphochaeta sp.]|nr:hypothetical protein [Fusobacterium sp. JB020]